MSNYNDELSAILGLPDMFDFWGIRPTRRTRDDGQRTVGAQGLKAIISRPHNLSVAENEKGEITAYVIDLVYTPFKRDDISVEILDDVLTVKVGGVKAEKAKERPMVYRGISAQPFEFQLFLKNFFDESEEIDTEAIKATPSEGILSLYLPLKKKAPPPQSKPIKIQLG